MIEPKPAASSVILPKWLLKLQQESWQAEILLLGLVLYSLLKAPDGIRALHDWFQAEVVYQVDMRNLAILLILAAYWLMAGFVMHLILRGVWVGYIGLSYVFPEGMLLDKIQLQPRFKENLQETQRPEHQIIRLENICSTLFGLSFFFFMCLLGAATFLVLFMGIILLLYQWLEDSSLFFLVKILANLLMICGLVYFLDFMTLGWLKRIRWFSVIYYPVYRFMSAITLAPLYRNIYYLLLSHVRRGILIVCLLFYIIISFALFVVEEQRLMNHNMSGLILFPYKSQGQEVMNANAYAATLKDPVAVKAYIQNEVIDNGPIRLVVVHRYQQDKEAVATCTNLQNSPAVPEKEYLNCLSAYYQLLLDGKKLPPTSWLFYDDELTGRKSILTYLEIDTLSRGKHVLEVVAGEDSYALIPFFSFPVRP